MTDQGPQEWDWDFLRRKREGIYDALQRIPEVYEALESLYGQRRTIWAGQSQVDMTNKVMIGCLQAEIETVAAKLEEIEAKYQIVREREGGWGVLARALDNVIFQNGTGDVCTVPAALVDILVNRNAFDGEVESRDAWVVFRGRDGTWKIPKSLTMQLREEGAPGAKR